MIENNTYGFYAYVNQLMVDDLGIDVVSSDLIKHHGITEIDSSIIGVTFMPEEDIGTMRRIYVDIKNFA